MDQTKPMKDAASYVQEDIEERKKIGLDTYGKLLFPDCKEDMLQYAYEEVLDLAIYLRNLLEQKKQPLQSHK